MTVSPERRAEQRECFRGHEGCVNDLLDALEEAELAYQGQAAATRALLADRDAEIAQLRGMLEGVRAVDDRGDRPYSATGPITEDTDIRAVTLLELEELVAMARRRDKHVVVVAGPCGRCGATRTAAVKPLFLEPELRLWSHFVMDMTTAGELLEGS